MAKEQKVNGVNQLTPEQEQMRMQVVDLELKARYWKAQWEIRYFTLEAEKIQSPYDQYIKDQQKMQEEALEDMKKQLTLAGLIDEEGNATEKANQSDLTPEHIQPVIDSINDEVTADTIVKQN